MNQPHGEDFSAAEEGIRRREESARRAEVAAREMEAKAKEQRDLCMDLMASAQVCFMGIFFFGEAGGCNWNFEVYLEFCT